MRCRWIIRALLIFLILLCLLGWPWSATRHAWVNYSYRDHYLLAATSWGGVTLGCGTGWSDGWHAGIIAKPDPHFLPDEGTLGFRCEKSASEKYPATLLTVPYWFLLALFSALLLLAWHRTAPPPPASKL